MGPWSMGGVAILTPDGGSSSIAKLPAAACASEPVEREREAQNSMKGVCRHMPTVPNRKPDPGVSKTECRSQEFVTQFRGQ